MSNPAFQLKGTRFTASGSFGLTMFGLAPFGGSNYDPYDLPTFHLGSDNLKKTLRLVSAEIVQARNGVTVSARPFADWSRWRVQFNRISEADVIELQAYFKARQFYLLPAGVTSNFIDVRWIDSEFLPRYLSPGWYSLSFEIGEVLQ